MGASTELVEIVASFLSGRRMTVKVGGAYSDLRSVNAGAPQGSVLGSMLFNVGTDDLDVGGSARGGTPPPREIETEPVRGQATSSPARANRNAFVFHAASPIPGRRQQVEVLPRVLNVPQHLRVQPTWREEEIKVLKIH